MEKQQPEPMMDLLGATTPEEPMMNFNDVVPPTTDNQPELELELQPEPEPESQPNPEPVPVPEEDDLLAGMDAEPAKPTESADAMDMLLMSNEAEEPKPAEGPKPAESPLDLGLLGDSSTPAAAPAAPAGTAATPVEPTSVTMAAELGNREYLRNEWKKDMLTWRSRQQQLAQKTEEVLEKQEVVRELHEKIERAKEELKKKEEEVKKRCRGEINR